MNDIAPVSILPAALEAGGSGAGGNGNGNGLPVTPLRNLGSPLEPRSRQQWIDAWKRNNAGMVVGPCSAKAMYRLADSEFESLFLGFARGIDECVPELDLQCLKERAFKVCDVFHGDLSTSVLI